MRDAVYKEALEVVREAQEVLADAGDLRTRLPALELLLLRLEASVLECSGEAVAALARVARATRLGDAAGVSPGVGDVLQQVRLLHRVLSPEYRELTKGPMQQAVQREAARLAAGLVAAGPWRHVQQLPRVFVPGLAARPWHSVESHFPALAPVQATLEAAMEGLQADLHTLQARGSMEGESECINDPGGGLWHVYTVTAPWHDVDAEGCSRATPNACALLRAVHGLGVPGLRVLRGGFSSLQPRAHLHPHCGSTNTQLKFHLGLVVPSKGGKPCARMRVANETRAWQQGKVLFFDDSWEHEVWNDCDSDRVVFQLVIEHPDMAVVGPQPGVDAALASAH